MDERNQKETPAVNAIHAPVSSRFKWIASVAIVVHLVAVFIEPFQFFTRSPRGESEAGALLRQWLAPYSEMAYLNHGYFFFAPEPGPSHLIAAKLTYENGDEAELRFPDKQAQWPRLLYHRHFMLAEFLNQMHAPPVELQLAQVDPALFKSWQANRNQFEAIRSSMEQHLISRYGAASATVTRLEHALPSSDDVLLRNRPLNDPALYISLPDAPSQSPPPVPYLAPSMPQAIPSVPLAIPQVAGEEVTP